MRKLLLISILFILSNATFAQQTQATKSYDPKMIGCWKGSEVEQQQKGLSKYWVSCRLENGTSILLFIAIDTNGEVTQTTENGKWWTENGKYYELHEVDGLIDIYDYEVQENIVKYKSIELMGKKDSSYSYIDTKIDNK
jgi:hypothetical protein